MKNRKYDIYVLTVLLIIVAAGFLLRPQSKSNMIKITLNKEVYGYYDLNKNQTIHINKENTLKIENHKIRMISATCPDHLCIKQGTINKKVVGLMRRRQIDYVVLAGFLWLVPENLLTAYPNRIVNIHPALLPRHGGKGMYGDRVHRAVVEAGDRETGITIHRVNERYDSGDILAQYRVPVTETDTPETVAAKVHALEYEHFPAEIEKEIARL